MKRWNAWRPAILLLAGGMVVGSPGFGPAELAAQDRPARIVVASGIQGTGWLGIQIEDRETAGEAGWWIVRVVSESPAEEAGLQDGDQLLEIDGDPMSEERLNALTTGLRPDDEVRLRIRRDGVESEYRITAARRPLMIFEPGEGGMAFSFDERGLPFAHDSIMARFRGAMDTLNFRLRELDLEGREWRFPDSFQGMHPDSLHVRGAFGFRVNPDSTEFGRVWIERSLAPLLGAGPRAVAGAELTPMNPGLAPYFGVDEGLLVVEVIEGGPLEQAGVRAGDVIVEVDGEAVTTVGDFRLHFQRGWRSPPVRVEVVRDGARRSFEVG